MPLSKPYNWKLLLSHLYTRLLLRLLTPCIWKNLEDLRQSTGTRHFIPGIFTVPWQKIATLMVEILVKATLITSAALGRDDPNCIAFPVRMTQQQQIFIKPGYEFFTVLVAITNPLSTLLTDILRFHPASQMVVTAFSKKADNKDPWPQANSFKVPICVTSWFRLLQWLPSDREVLWLSRVRNKVDVLACTSPGVSYGCFIGNWLSSSRPPPKPHLVH